MRDARDRQFTWLDGLILVVFVGLALAVAVLHDGVTFRFLSYYLGREVAWPALPWWFQALHVPAKRVQCDFLAFLDVISIGVALVLFRRPPRRFPSLPTPGGSATAAAVAAILWGKATFFVYAAGDGRGTRSLIEGLAAAQAEFLPGAESVTVAGAVLGVWGYLVLARAWKARDHWRDWLGRWLGWAWISAAALRALLLTLWG